ncbi:hypothetical protein ACV33Y_33730, partial [Pseudomonas aeruginosa]
PKVFFQEIARASDYMRRDPAQLVKGSNLAQSGVLGEYLEGLPYRSKSLNMTQDLWLSLSVAEPDPVGDVVVEGFVEVDLRLQFVDEVLLFGDA